MFHPMSAVRAALPAALILTLAAAPAAADDRSLDWTWTLSRGQTLEVRGLNGPITVTAASGRQARVTAHKTEGRRCDPEEVRIEVAEDDRGVMVCALYPRRDGGENVCGEENQSNDNCDVQVEFTIEVPAGVHFVGRTVNGGVRATGISASAELSTVNGSIELETTSWGSATTVNGSIQAAIGAERWDGELEFTTVNGRIELELPQDVSADVRGQLMNGRLDSDFPLSVRGRTGMRRVRGTLGDGGSALELSTVNGNLVLRARD